MKYNIISINDDRKAYKDAIRDNVPYEEFDYPAVNGREVSLPAEIEARGLRLDPVWGNAKIGELGVWLSNFDRWWLADHHKTPLICFEDDAVVKPDFAEKFEGFMAELPDDWDFAALWVPENQRVDFLYDLWYEKGIPRINGIRSPENSLFAVPGCRRAALVYQGYGMVSLVYSPKGGAKLVELAREYGITGPVDCWIYEQAHMNNVKGYAPRPDFADIVNYDWAAESHVQLTERA